MMEPSLYARSWATTKHQMIKTLAQATHLPAGKTKIVVEYLVGLGVPLDNLADVDAPKVLFVGGMPRCPYEGCTSEDFECIERGGYNTSIDFDLDGGALHGRVSSDHAETETIGYACGVCGGPVDIPGLDLDWV